MSDPRLDGAFTIEYTKDRFTGTAQRNLELGWGPVQLVNDSGAWEGMEVGTSDLNDSSRRELGVWELVGSGDYEGLSAVLFWTEGSPEWSMTGIIFPGDLPPDRE